MYITVVPDVLRIIVIPSQVEIDIKEKVPIHFTSYLSQGFHGFRGKDSQKVPVENREEILGTLIGTSKEI